jgi:RNA polymerase sigma-70 factor (ECF subfamily)
MVFRTLARMLGSQEHVADLAQEVFLRLYRALPHFEGRAQLSTYLYRIVVNVAQDEWKRQRHPLNRPASLDDPVSGWEERLCDLEPTAEVMVERREMWRLVQVSLQALPDAERVALTLYHQEDRSYEAIAGIMDLPIGTVRTHIHRGRTRLARLVRERMTRSDV